MVLPRFVRSPPEAKRTRTLLRTREWRLRATEIASNVHVVHQRERNRTRGKIRMRTHAIEWESSSPRGDEPETVFAELQPSLAVTILVAADKIAIRSESHGRCPSCCTSTEQTPIIDHPASVTIENQGTVTHHTLIIDHRSSITSHRSSVINRRSTIINHQSSFIDRQSSFISRQLSAINQPQIINRK